MVIVAPFLGTLVYLIFRRPGATPEERRAVEAASQDFVARYTPDTHTRQLEVVADLHDGGKLSDAEYEAEKIRILSLR